MKGGDCSWEYILGIGCLQHSVCLHGVSLQSTKAKNSLVPAIPRMCTEIN
jgi:hypothetical protein